MKRLLLLISILLPLSSGSAAPARSASKARVATVIAECRSMQGAEVLHLGRLATAGLKGALRLSAGHDPDVREALRVMKGIRSVSIFYFDECSEADKTRIVQRLDQALDGNEMLLEARDGREKMQLYGLVDMETDHIRNFVLYAPEEGALICLFGTLSVETLSGLISHD